MAAVGENVTDAHLNALQGKREVIERVVDEALKDLGPAVFPAEVVFTFCHAGVAYMGHKNGNCHSHILEATDDNWDSALSEGLGKKFTLDWVHPKYTGEDFRVHRLGEPIFEAMMRHGLNPEWDGTLEGEFSITAVDMVGAKLALAMSLHPRLGCDSPLSLVSYVAHFLCLAVSWA